MITYYLKQYSTITKVKYGIFVNYSYYTNGSHSILSKIPRSYLKKPFLGVGIKKTFRKAL